MPSKVTKFIRRIGFTVPVNHEDEKILFFVKWFFWDWKNNILAVWASDNWLFGSTFSIQIIRPALHRFRGVKIGKCVAIGKNATIGVTYPSDVEIGDHCRISDNVVIEEHGRSLEHFKQNTSIIELPVYRKTVKIGSYSHIGVGAIILPGVIIGEYSVVGAGAVVRKNVPANSLVVGNPAEVVYTFPN